MSEMHPVQRRFTNGVEEPIHVHTNGTGSHLGTLGEEENTIRGYLGLFRRHWFLIFSIVAVCTGLAGYRAYTAPPEFRSTAVIQLSDTRRMLTGSLAGPGVNPAALGDPIISQIEVLRSRSVTGMVVDAVGLRLQPTTPEFSYALIDSIQVDPNTPADSIAVRFGPTSYTVSSDGRSTSAPYGTRAAIDGVSFIMLQPGQLEEVSFRIGNREDAAAALVGGLLAERRDRTNLIDVGYTANDPILAQRVVNSAIEQFQLFNASVAQREARRRRIFIESQLVHNDSLLVQGLTNLASFRIRERVFSTTSDLASRQATRGNLLGERSQLLADVRVYSEVIERLRSETPAVQTQGLQVLLGNSRLTSSPAVSPYYTQFVRYQTSLDSLTNSGYAPGHQQVQQIAQLAEGARSDLLRAMDYHMDGLQSQIEVIDELVGQDEQSLTTLPMTEIEEVGLLAQVDHLSATAAGLRTEYQQARIEEAVQEGQIETVDPALPGHGIAASQRRTVLFGLILGLMLGSGAALALENANTSIRRKDEVEKVLRVPELAVIPRFASAAPSVSRSLVPARFRSNGTAASANGTAADLITAKDPHSQAAEAYRTLRTNLIFSQALHPLETLAVTSSAPSEGKSTTAANVAASFAQQGKRVLLVDCDLRKARLHKMFGVPREPGFTHLLLGLKGIAEVVRPTAVEGLSFLASGTLPPNPAELVGGEQMRATLELLKREFDLVVLDTPPLLAASDAALMGRLVDGVLLVVRAGHTERDAARQAVRQLASGNARILGAVLNDPDDKVSNYGGHYRYEYYGERQHSHTT